MKVNLKALDSRLRTIFSHMSLIDVDGLGQRRAIYLELAARRARQRERKLEASSAVKAARSVGS